MLVFENIETYFQNIRDLGEHSKSLVTLATFSGAILILYLFATIIYHSIQGLRLYVLSQIPCCRTDFVKRYGKWAIVTGSTDGIGLALARELARRGHSLILISRNEEKLAACKASIEEEPSAGEVVTIKMDLSDSSVANYERVLAEIDPSNRDIGILINNAGTFPGDVTRLHNMDLEYLRTIGTINMLGVAMFTRLMIPTMLKRGGGLIVNVSSLIAISTMPFMNIYGPTKKFVNSFTDQMRREYADYPIDFITLTPGGVNTKLLTAISKQTQVNPDPEFYARSSLNALSARVHPTAGIAFHGFMSIMMRLLEIFGLMGIGRQAFLLGTHKANLTPKMKRKVKWETNQQETTAPAGDS